MPVVAHAEHDEIEAGNSARFAKAVAQHGLVARGGLLRRFRGRVPGVDVSRRDWHEIEEPSPGLARVAFRRPKGNPALVSPEDMDAIPWNPRAIRFARQDRTHLFGRCAAGKRDKGPP